MSGEIKVTVIATGFENEIVKPAPKQRGRFGSEEPGSFGATLSVPQTPTVSSIPFFGRQAPAQVQPSFPAEIEPNDNAFVTKNHNRPETKEEPSDEDELDVPSFIRRKLRQ